MVAGDVVSACNIGSAFDTLVVPLEETEATAGVGAELTGTGPVQLVAEA